MTIEGGRVISPDAFIDYSKLDLRVRDPSENLLAIPFEELGHYVDEERFSMPDKTHYRTQVLKFFAGIDCMPGTTMRIDTAAIIAAGPKLRC